MKSATLALLLILAAVQTNRAQQHNGINWSNNRADRLQQSGVGQTWSPNTNSWVRNGQNGVEPVYQVRQAGQVQTQSSSSGGINWPWKWDWRPWQRQSVGAKGTLMCGGAPLVGARVKIWDDDTGILPDDELASVLTDNNGRFELSGSTTELTTIDPRLKIYHDCNDQWMLKSGPFKPCQRRVKFFIPKEYVNYGNLVSKWYDIGIMEMQGEFSGEERDCTNY